MTISHPIDYTQTMFGGRTTAALTAERAQVFSFFAGAGFLDLGFEDEGFEIVFVNEFHAPFLEAYQYARRKLKKVAPRFGYSAQNVEDLSRPAESAQVREMISLARLSGNPVGFIGGPPCPDFSNAGKHRGRDGANGSLTKTYVQLIVDHQPDFFAFENVKGLHSNHLSYLNELQAMLTTNGFVIATRVINALEYGVPQSRERLLIIGFHQRFLDTKAQPNSVMIDPDSWFEAELQYDADALKGLPWPGQQPFKPGSRRRKPIGLPAELTVQHWFNRNRVAKHPNAIHQFRPRSGLKRMLQVAEGDVSKKSYKRLHRWRYSATAAYGNNEVHLHPHLARRITASEALAIQSMPRAFELPPTMSLSDMFKTVGNGVPYLMGRGIARTLQHIVIARSNSAPPLEPAPAQPNAQIE